MGIPWDAMSLPWCSIYMADDSLLSFPDLNPAKMSREHAYSIFDYILASQSKQKCFIKFSIAGDALRKLQLGGDEGYIDEEIIELDNPLKSPSKLHKRSPRKEKTSKPQEFIDFSPPPPPFGSITLDTSERTEFPPASATLPVITNPSKVSAPSLAPPTPGTVVENSDLSNVMDLSQSPSDAAFKKGKTKAKMEKTGAKRKADVEGTVSAGPALKKHKGMVKMNADKQTLRLGPKGAFSPRKPSAR
jgi:hypothetical protein